MREHGQILPAKRGFENIGKSDAVAVPVVGGGLDDHANGAARTSGLSVGSAHFNERHDLRAGRKDKVRDW